MSEQNPYEEELVAEGASDAVFMPRAPRHWSMSEVPWEFLDVTDRSVWDVFLECERRGLNPRDVKIEYEGCGSHRVVMGWRK